MSKKIANTTYGMADHFIGYMENVADNDDMDIEKKIKLAGECAKNIRGFMSLEIQNRKLMVRSPDIAKNPGLAMNVGTPKLEKKSES